VNGGAPYWTITFKGVEDNETYKTHIDTSMENFRNWETIIYSKDELVLGSLKLKSKRDKLINADSIPRIVSATKPQAHTKYLPPAANNFNNLFE
jgi:hypothetical protein